MLAPDQALADLLGQPPLARLLAVLNGEGEETRIVGGAVRNTLFGRPVSEVDLATTALPEEVIRRASGAGFRSVPTGIDHGTVTVLVDGQPFEVTTLREDVETDGRRAVVRFGRSFEADALRRDFSINAMSLSADGTLYDYCGGVADLAARRVRFIGEARTRIREDYLRVLRFFRFHAEYGEGDPDAEGLSAAIAERAGLAILSFERIRAELLKLLVSRRAVEVVGVITDAGLLGLLLAGVVERGRLARVASFEAQEGEMPDAARRLAALAVWSIDDAERLKDRLRLSNEEHARLDAYARLQTVLRSEPEPIDAVGIRRLSAEHGPDRVTDVLAAIAGEPMPRLAPDVLNTLRKFRTGELPVPVFPLRGADLVAHGVPKGPRVGQLLALARRAWLDEGCPTDASVARRLLHQALGMAH